MVDEAKAEREEGRVARIAGWVPPLLALGLFAQIAFLGLRPTLREHYSLERKEAALREIEAGREQRLGDLENWIRAQDDPIYRERVRLRALDPQR